MRRLASLALLILVSSQARATYTETRVYFGPIASRPACTMLLNGRRYDAYDANSSGTCTSPGTGSSFLGCGCDGVTLTWVSTGGGGGGGGTPSALLDGGTMHTDTTNSAVTRGDIIVGNSTPAWDDLAIGSNGKVLKSNGTDPAWGFVDYSELTGIPSAPVTGNTQYKLYNTTTNATLTELFLNGSSTRLTMPNSSTWTVTCWVAARRTDSTGGRAGWKLDFVVFKDTTAGSTAFVGSLVKMTTGKADSAWDVTALPDTSNGTAVLKVTGEAAKTIDWVASCLIAEAT